MAVTDAGKQPAAREIAPLPAPPAEAPLKRFLSDFAASRLATGAALLLAAIIVVAFLSPVISPQDPYDLATVSVLDARLPPGSENFAGYTHWLGTDGAGRDLLSAILYGLRISISVGLASGVIALFVGMAIGLVAAYVGGRTETLIMRVVDLQLSLPAVLVALILLAILGKGIDKIIIALVVAQWAYYARTVRASALVERRCEYVEAAQSLGLSHARIMFRHILPNCLAPLIVVGTVQTAHAIALEATLSFLGVGLPQTEPSLGLLIANGFEYMISGKYWISVFPGLALLLTIVSINMVGDQLRDVLNPRLQK
ncbi:ABC transporter permease [Rhizobiales bacterium]|uniref:ABC transporter permease n=1 Tax=Hongsoonwoonella zoysiae TaxID=2821844 RepID=UPI0015619518|nr:ABC transporter permease [Hongsoonwoonella zoysiae]NRG16684.1 ABC transporter permease [Hongsoonwoonella zoysiae]